MYGIKKLQRPKIIYKWKQMYLRNKIYEIYVRKLLNTANNDNTSIKAENRKLIGEVCKDDNKAVWSNSDGVDLGPIVDVKCVIN
jgi:hypothetical protein